MNIGIGSGENWDWFGRKLGLVRVKNGLGSGEKWEELVRKIEQRERIENK